MTDDATDQEPAPVESVPVAVTWRDWLPAGTATPADDELITRGELLARLKDVGVELTPRTLQTWEQLGIMPRPTRRWHNGANRSFYPAWVVYIGRLADSLKTYGAPIEGIRERIRRMVPRAMREAEIWSKVLGDHRLDGPLGEMAEQFELAAGESLASIEVRLTLPDGQVWGSYTLNLPAPHEAPRDDVRAK